MEMEKIEEIDWIHEGGLSETASLTHRTVDDVFEEHNYLILVKNPEYDARN